MSKEADESHGGIDREGVWFKSSFSGDDSCCVEILLSPSMVQVRDTKPGRSGQISPILSFTPPEWEAFIAGAKAGEFDLSGR